MVTWVTCVRGLPESVGLCVAWVKFLRELCELRGLNIFYVGQHVTWVIIFRGLRGSNIFLRGSKFFVWVNFLTWVNIFCEGLSFWVGQFLGGDGSKKILIGAFRVIS